MPVVTPGSKILVSGANGYIAAWVVHTLLERGYGVRGTVRSVAKGRFLQELFKKYGDKFEIAIVEDITKEGAFDEAVKGVDAIQHLASPVHLSTGEPQELIVPAVNGTLSILKSALKNAPTAQRVVVTSSTAAVLHVSEKPLIFTELDWNEQSVKEVEEQGRHALPLTKYRASKTLSEKATWEFYEKNRDKVNWDLTVINPPWVFGPIMHEVSTPESLNISVRQFYDAVVVVGSKSDIELSTQGNSWVDVRDLAEAQARALEKEAAGGERIIVSAGSFIWQQWVDIANSFSPSPIPSHSSLPKGIPGAAANAFPLIRYDASKAAKILGITYRTKEELTRDALADFEARGL